MSEFNQIYSRPLPLAAMLLLAAAAACGCGKSRELTALNGNVTYNGRPLQFGTVMLQAKSGQPATGKIQPDGTFTLVTRGEGEGVPVGECRIRVLCYEGQNPEVLAKKPGADLGRALIPQKFMAYETSGLSVEIKPSGNEPLVLNLADR